MDTATTDLVHGAAPEGGHLRAEDQDEARQTRAGDLRRLAIRFAAFAGLQVLILAALMSHYHRNDEILLGAVRSKHDRLERLSSPRVILVGGSNVLYGLDSRTIAKGTGLPHVVNMALTAPLGVELMLNEVRDELRSGDVVLLSFEYDHFCQQVVSYRDLAWLLEQRPASVGDMSLGEKKLLLDDGLLYLRGILHGLARSGPREQDLIHHIRYINAYGDSTVSQSVHVEPPADPSELPCEEGMAGLIDEQVERIEAFRDEAARKGARVFYTHPSFERRSLLANHEAIGAIRARLSDALGAAVLTEPRETSFARRDMLDSNYHLVHPAKMRRSLLVGSRLKQALMRDSRIRADKLGDASQIELAAGDGVCVHGWRAASLVAHASPGSCE